MDYSKISSQINLPSGGGLSRYLKNLEEAQFISEITPFGAKSARGNKRYQLTDSYINFYLKFIATNKAIIKSGSGKQLFEKIRAKNLDIYSGLQFEKFCIRHANILAKKMGFGDYFLKASPYFKRGEDGFQIDLLFERSDQIVVLAEIKYSDQQIGTSVIPEVERKLALLKKITNLRIQKALISTKGPNRALVDSEYFDYSLDASQLF